MSNRYNVQVHQAGSTPSVSGSYSLPSGTYTTSSGSSTPRPVSSGAYREYGAVKHTSEAAKFGSTLVINHRKTDYEHGSPTPRYGGGYQ